MKAEERMKNKIRFITATREAVLITRSRGNNLFDRLYEPSQASWRRLRILATRLANAGQADVYLATGGWTLFLKHDQ